MNYINNSVKILVKNVPTDNDDKSLKYETNIIRLFKNAVIFYLSSLVVNCTLNTNFGEMLLVIHTEASLVCTLIVC